MPHFSYKTYVRMYDTDTAQILFFGSQFRLINDALEELLRLEGLTFHHLFRESDYCFVVVHAESDYIHSLVAGDEIDIHVKVAHIGQTSFSFQFDLYKQEGILSGKSKTTHVVIDPKTRQKKNIPPLLRTALEKYQ